MRNLASRSCQEEAGLALVTHAWLKPGDLFINLLTWRNIRGQQERETDRETERETETQRERDVRSVKVKD